VKVQEDKSQEVVQLPTLVKDEKSYKMTTTDETCKKLFLKVDEDDPVIKMSDSCESVVKKVSKELEMEEIVCHGEVMEQVEDIVSNEMLGGDKSLKAILMEERTEVSEMKKPEKDKSRFKRNKDKLEEFFMTNVQEMLKEKELLYSAEEKFKERKIINSCKKELCHEMNRFELELVKCKDGKTKVRIIQENDVNKDWEMKKIMLRKKF
jgi:hypothetical protein